MDLSNKVVVITGAARGIGRQTALLLAELSATVVVNDLDSMGAQATTEMIEKKGEKSLALGADVSKEQDVCNMFHKVYETFGTIDILINNAGTVLRKAAEKISESEWDRILDTNLKGTFICSKQVVRYMISRGRGKIINVSSIMGNTALPPRAAYSASKGGINALTRALAAEWAPHGITVNAVAPGWTLTEMTREYFSHAAIKKHLLERIPLGRFAKSIDIANAIAFLASDYSDYITGQIIHVDGGWTIL